MKLWDGRSGKFLTNYNGHVGSVYQVCWSSDSRCVHSIYNCVRCAGPATAGASTQYITVFGVLVQRQQVRPHQYITVFGVLVLVEKRALCNCMLHHTALFIAPSFRLQVHCQRLQRQHRQDLAGTRGRRGWRCQAARHQHASGPRRRGACSFLSCGQPVVRKCAHCTCCLRKRTLYRCHPPTLPLVMSRCFKPLNTLTLAIDVIICLCLPAGVRA